ncbi:hypothetical protein WAA20_06435 [Butyrivibrio fibrisolvens]|uniref:hypothetical protein n=1 Tax=Butyrivibrio fibrisolvens TaxID=831 RepID=UPI001114DB72|nr:hypothetical protein [Butyrivibrio fibrisolvens]
MSGTTGRSYDMFRSSWMNFYVGTTAHHYVVIMHCHARFPQLSVSSFAVIMHYHAPFIGKNMVQMWH